MNYINNVWKYLFNCSLYCKLTLFADWVSLRVIGVLEAVCLVDRKFYLNTLIPSIEAN